MHYITKGRDGKPLRPAYMHDDLMRDGAENIARPIELIPNLVCVAATPQGMVAVHITTEADLQAYINMDVPKWWLEYEHAELLAE